MTSYANSFANKPALVNTMSVLLASTYTEVAPTLNDGTVSNLSVAGSNNNYLIELSLDPSGMFIGASFDASGVEFMIVASTDSSGTVAKTFNPASKHYLVDTVVTKLSNYPIRFNTITNTLHPLGSATVQDILNLFLSSVSKLNYSFVIASLIQVINSNKAFYGNGAGRILCTVDDGSVFIDTSKMLIYLNLVYSASACTYQNFLYKIKNAGTQKMYSASNTVTVNDISSNPVTLTVGSAGGNNINENHNTRPEILLALLSSGGVGFANRYSTSTSSINQYYAVRFGTVSEYNIGTIRINVPVVVGTA